MEARLVSGKPFKKPSETDGQSKDGTQACGCETPCDGYDHEPKFETKLEREKCQWCKDTTMLAEHSLRGLRLRCTVCGRLWPTNSFITLKETECPNLFAVLRRMKERLD